MSESKPVTLQSVSNPTIRHLVRMRDNRARRKAGRVIVDGWRETAQALEAGLNLCGLYLPESEWARSDFDKSAIGRDPEIQRVLEHPSVLEKTTCVSDQIMGKISYGQSIRGVVAEFEQPTRTLDQLDLPRRQSFWCWTESKSRETSARSFAAPTPLGLMPSCLCESNDLFNPNAIRSSLGCVFHVRSASGTESQVKQFLIDRGIRVMAARVESSTPAWSANFEGSIAIILGSESQGLGDRWQNLGNDRVEGVRIPMCGKVDSLNVSVSAAVIAFEAMRRRETARIDGTDTTATAGNTVTPV